MDFDVINTLLKEDQKSKIVLLVMDGLGGLPMTEGGKTELETLSTEYDALAAKSVLGAHHPLPFGDPRERRGAPRFVRFRSCKIRNRTRRAFSAGC